jgi:uncharacterized membrane protein YqjE
MVISSLKTLIRSVAGLLNTHLMMLQLDFQEEKERLTRLLLSLLGLTLFAGMLLIMLTMVLCIALWPYSPLYTAIGLAVFYACITLFFVCRIRALLKRSAPFSMTLSELEKNREVFFDE